MNETTFDCDGLRIALTGTRYGGCARTAALAGERAQTFGGGRDVILHMARGNTLTEERPSLLTQATALEQHIKPGVETVSPQYFTARFSAVLCQTAHSRLI